jgi:PEP-CTERM motif
MLLEIGAGMRLTLICLSFFGICSLFSSAVAAPVFPDPSAPGDQILINVPGFFDNRTIAFDEIVNIAGGAGQIFDDGYFPLPAIGTAVALTEQVGSAVVVTDLVFVGTNEFPGGALHLFFAQTPNGDFSSISKTLLPTSVNIVAYLPESEMPQDVGIFFGAQSGSIEEVDVPNPVSPVPEPSTWAMLLIGFAGIGFLSLRNQKRLSFSG